MNLSNYNLFLCDKYSIEFNSFIKNKKFDLIVDTNLKSYSCCKDTFIFYMNNLFKTLNNNGTLIHILSDGIALNFTGIPYLKKKITNLLRN